MRSEEARCKVEGRYQGCWQVGSLGKGVEHGHCIGAVTTSTTTTATAAAAEAAVDGQEEDEDAYDNANDGGPSIG